MNNKQPNIVDINIYKEFYWTHTGTHTDCFITVQPLDVYTANLQWIDTMNIMGLMTLILKDY